MKHILQMAIALLIIGGFLLAGTSRRSADTLWREREEFGINAQKILASNSDFKEIQIQNSQDHSDSPALPSQPEIKDESKQMLSIYDAQQQAPINISVQDYLLGVLAVEMPAYYNIEALKAQAVAARTYLVNKIQNGGCKKYGEYDICSSCGHCQGYQSAYDRKQKWGSGFEKYEQKMLEAVKATESMCLSYNGDLINAMYHSSSAGRTEDYSERYGSTFLPYLVSVTTPENVDQISKTTYFKYDELVNIILKKYPDCGINVYNVKSSIRITEKTTSGRAAKVKIGNKTVSGIAFAGMLWQKSTDISLVIMQDKMLVLCRGNGHGVGMSQVGANIMADQGKSFDEILAHYYQKTDIIKITGNMYRSVSK